MRKELEFPAYRCIPPADGKTEWFLRVGCQTGGTDYLPIWLTIRAFLSIFDEMLHLGAESEHERKTALRLGRR